MNIGELSKLSEVNAKMIRRYEEHGIIPKANRSLSGYRTYSETDVHILRFVKKAREFGFSMKDIKQLVSLWRNKNRKSEVVKNLASKHLNELKTKRDELDAMIGALSFLVHSCHGDQRPDCPILNSIED